MGSVSCWRDWISSLISTASTHVLLNGDLVILIYNVRCCFILLMEILHGLLMKTVQSGVLAPPANPSSAAVPDCWTDPPVQGQRLATASPSGNYMHQRLFYRKDSECCPGEYQETGSESEGKDEGPGPQVLL
uniref:Uncharacterized protein n=1 Tax=Setaria viridis TaxID=4556 RepID=A0A4U6UCI2_SETVI|nr:hypothetical protein SEVIR_6G221800v2 [Setaria viridis]